MRELRIEEFELVSGGQGIAGAIVGSVTGVATYLGEVLGEGGSATTSGVVKAVVISGALGAIGGAGAGSALKAGAAAIGLPSAGFYTGLGAGLIVRDYGAQDGTNYNADGCDYN